MQIKKCLVFFALIYLVTVAISAQQSLYLEEVSLSIDTSTYRWTEHRVEVQEEERLYFYYQEENPVVEMRFYPGSYPLIDSMKLLPSGNYTVVDSLLKIEGAFRLRLKLKNLTETNFLAITARLYSRHLRGGEHLVELPLMPLTKTEVALQTDISELFIGEEKVLKVATDNLKNIRASGVWKSGEGINYKFSKRKGELFIHLLPTQLGTGKVEAALSVRRPYRDTSGSLQYQLPPLVHSFTIKPAKLAFLKINKREVSLNTNSRREGIEIELDYNSSLQMQKTYRLEGREQAGGALVAEIFTRQVLANGNALCWLRLYDYHRRTEGYLYIKDGDEARFITNLDIVPQTNISSISLRREGQDWMNSRVVYPGERLEVRLEGQSLHRANFRFEGLEEVKHDSLVRSETEVVFSGLVPLHIDKKRIHLFNGSQRTGQSLQVQEYERPRPFDFIYLNYGEERESVSASNTLIFFPEILKDIFIEFDREMIDEGKLHGEQHLEIEIQVRSKSNQLIDTRTIPKILIAPGESSPRYHFYEQGKSRKTGISLNQYLRKKTFDLETWTSIRLTIRHRQDKYGEEGYSKTIEFNLFREATFNIDVSFPAGLLVKQLDESGFGNLGGISMAMIAQFSFYKQNTIANAKPFKVGAGFLAFNAFNFNENNDNRDVGLVGLASLYPIKTKESSRFSFPLFMGGGYFLAKSEWFLLLGPGIRVRL